MTSGEIPEGNPTIMVDFKISQLAVSGLKVSRLDIYGEVRIQTISGLVGNCKYLLWYVGPFRY